MRDDFCKFWRKTSRGAVSTAVAGEIFGWNFKDKVRRPNGLRSKKPPKKFCQNKLGCLSQNLQKSSAWHEPFLGDSSIVALVCQKPAVRTA
ncbi:MAG: hypothetical protein MR658_05260 [Campylobacter sp.]|nr:hypothetical protein [Campylobacter sp.]